MLHYAVNDFFNTECDDTMSVIIDKKVSLLYDFCILTSSHKHSDPREYYVRKMLADCDTEYHMSILLRDVLTDKITLDDLLHRKGVM